MKLLIRFARDQRGATAIEYAMIAVIISIAGIGALAIIGPAVMDMFANAAAPF
ncbi:Flp family type IVb pilin [Maricaulis sp.]|jgi:pilus assembly protein Flp/PilA|uniref:Flp family type IVb pilin n=1 Tax=Maricaulis sp. TaxID=1486257 RepID=UPI0025DADE17|nr:Flp family type IVb pilin [Maricaulis sp.]MDF1768414.1 Flp family type IVb pilin [Maricaulis sp.]